MCLLGECAYWGGGLPTRDVPARGLVCLLGALPTRGFASWRPSPIVTSSGGHYSGRYPSYWNTFLF